MTRSRLLACVLVTGCFHPTGVDPSLLSSSMPSSSGDTTEIGGSVGTNETSIETSIGTGEASSSTGTSTTSGTTSAGGCGDGVLADGEECDDMNQDAGDGCADCVKEFRRVFVTSKVFTGDLGGLAGADQKCQDAANAATLPGIYKAWLSVSGESAADRFFHSLVPYRLINGEDVAKDWDDLTDETLLSPIYLSEFNGTPGTGVHSCAPAKWIAWTGTSPSGAPDPTEHFCTDWIGTGEGRAGWVGEVQFTWTQSCSAPCQDQAALYCFEQ